MNNSTASVLNDLIETLKDGQDGFRAAADAVKASDLKAVFNEYSLQRSKFAGELQALARSVGEKDPETTGSAAAAMHRGWINLKSAMTDMDDHAVLAECERGEDSAVAAYKKALESEELPANVAETVRTQYSAIQAAHDTVRNLRDSRAKAA